MRHALHQAARGLGHLVHGLGQQLEVGGVVDALGAAQQQVVVVAGEALEEPQKLRVVLLGVVVGGQLGRAQALDVPGVEVLVADQAQERGVALGLFVRGGRQRAAWLARKVLAVADQGGGVFVLQATVAVVHGVQHEDVVFEWNWALGPVLLARAAHFFDSSVDHITMPEAQLGLTNGLRVGQQLGAVKAGRRTGHHKAVRNAAGHKAAAPKRAHLHRAVHQGVVVVGAVKAKTGLGHAHRLQPGGHAPAFECVTGHQRHRVRGLRLLWHLQAQAGAVEKAARGVQPGGAHRVVKRVDLVLHLQRCAGDACHFPGGFVLLLHGHPFAGLAGFQLLQVFGKFPHQVAARNPHRQAQGLGGGRHWHRERDPEQVRVDIQHLYLVVHRGNGRGGGASFHVKLASSPRRCCASSYKTRSNVRRLDQPLAAARCFSICGASMAPGTRLPSWKISVGVPLMR